MRTLSLRLTAVLLALFVTINSPAQELPTIAAKPVDPAAPDLAALNTGLRFREDAATRLMTGTEKVAETIVRLKAHASPSGLKLDHDTDFSYAAIDIGQRLVARGFDADAQKLFQAAEGSLALVVAKTPNTSPKNKAMLLQKLALLRGEYLGNPTQAKADIEAAIKLQPDEKYFQSQRDQLAKENGQIFTRNPVQS